MPNYGRFVQLAEEVRIMSHPRLSFEKRFEISWKVEIHVGTWLSSIF
jgi:hypothetical protein